MLDRFTITSKAISETIKFLQESSPITISRMRSMSLNNSVSTWDGRMFRRSMGRALNLHKLNSSLFVWMVLTTQSTIGQKTIPLLDFPSHFTSLSAIETCRARLSTTLAKQTATTWVDCTTMTKLRATSCMPWRRSAWKLTWITMTTCCLKTLKL